MTLKVLKFRRTSEWYPVSGAAKLSKDFGAQLEQKTEMFEPSFFVQLTRTSPKPLKARGLTWTLTYIHSPPRNFNIL